MVNIHQQQRRWLLVLGWLLTGGPRQAVGLSKKYSPFSAFRRIWSDERGNAGRAAETESDADSPTFGFIDENIGGVPSVDDLPWQPVAQQADTSSSNLCVEGKLLPQLYILGAAKSATTSLAADLLAAGIEGVGRDCRMKDDPCTVAREPNPQAKEFHYFDFATSWSGLDDDGLELERIKWRKVLPDCGVDAPLPVTALARKVKPALKAFHAPPAAPSTANAPPKRRVLADFTPESMRLTPMPSGVRPYGSFQEMSAARFLPVSDDTEETEQVNLPRLLQYVYKEHASRVTFVIMLREPAARMQSHWYCCICPKSRCGPRRSFQGDMLSALGRAEDPDQPQYSDWLWYSMYRHHIKAWIDRFDPSQLYVVPYQQFGTGDKDSICRDLSDRLKFDMNCNSKGANATWIGNPDTHPSVEKDMTPEAFKSVNDFMNREVDLLAILLMRAHQRGAGLANFNGRTGSSRAVRTWLTTNW